MLANSAGEVAVKTKNLYVTPVLWNEKGAVPFICRRRHNFSTFPKRNLVLPK